MTPDQAAFLAAIVALAAAIGLTGGALATMTILNARIRRRKRAAQ